ncbi:Tetratricopeptide tpr1 [Globisporangium polare]
MPKVLQRHADSMSSSGSSSFSSLHDYSDDDSECEELIAKYVRRGAPITTLSSSNGSTKHLGRSRVDSTPLEAIKEKHSLENPSQVDTVMKTLHQTPPLPASAVTGRTLQNRTMSGASAGTVSVTDSEEAEDSSDDASSFSDCDEEPVDEGHGEPSTPPARTLKAVAPIQPAAVKTAAAPAKREVLPVTPEKPRARKTPVLKPATVTAAAPYKITEQDRCVMREIAALELEIQKCQSELPELLEYLKKTERTAARLQEEAHESKLRVQQYKKAHCVVNRSIRNARALMKEQEYQAAILELLRASGIDRSSTTVWFLLAECRLKVGQLEDAEMACRKCFRLMQHACDRGGSGAACVALLGKILHEQGRHDEAIECYLTSLKR